MEKFLIVIFQCCIPEDWISFIIKIIKCFNASVFINSPISHNLIAGIVSKEGLKEERVKERLIREAYINLYYLEDRFKKEGVKVTISAKEVSMVEEFISNIKKINPRMVFLVGNIEVTILESIKNLLSIPILLLPGEEK